VKWLGALSALVLSTCLLGSAQSRVNPPTTSSKAVATAALGLAQSTLRDTAYVGPNIHTLLLRNLNTLELAAQVSAADDGKDVAVTSFNNNKLFDAIRESADVGDLIADRETETQAVRDRSRQLAIRLRALLAAPPASGEGAPVDPVAVQIDIARNKDFDVASLWGALGIPAQLDTVYPRVHVGAANYMSDATLARCGGVCTAEITQASLEAGATEDLILKIYQEYGPARFLFFRPTTNPVGTGAWQFIGHADHDFGRHYTADYRTGEIGDRRYFIMVGEGTSGTGISLQYDRWYEIRQADVHEVLSLPAKGSECLDGKSLCREFASTVASGTANASQFVVNFTVRYWGNQYLLDGTDGDIPLFTRTQRGVYARPAGSDDYALAAQGSDITARELPTVFDPGFGSLACQDFFAFNANNIAAIVSGGDTPAKRWLSRYAADCK
jgi:hypothetical protein